jgi:hypothetical protein
VAHGLQDRYAEALVEAREEERLGIAVEEVALGIGEGAEFRAPLGRAVIGGVITSTLLTLVVIPTFYEILDEWKEWMLRKFGLLKHTEGGHAGQPTGPRPVSASERLEKLA